MGADANAAQPPARPRVLPRPEKFVYEPEQETEILQQVCQFAPVTQDLIVQLYLSRETTPVISTVVARHAEGGVLSNCLAEELLYPLEWVRRRLLHLESD